MTQKVTEIQPMSQGILQVAQAVSRQRVVRHILWWVFFYALLVFLEWKTFSNPQFAETLQDALLTEAISVVFYMILYYACAEYLIPNYLAKNRTVVFWLSLVSFVILLTPIRDFALLLRFSTIENMQEVVRYNHWSSYFVLLFFAIVSTIVKIISDWTTQTRRQRELETRNIQTELNFLKAQINPHFLFNTLNSLYALSLKKSDDAPEIVLKLSEMMRYMLYECNESSVSLEKEIRYLQNYLDLEKMRLGAKMDVRFTVQGEAVGLQIAPLLLIPFVENAFKHGAANTLRGGFVDVFLMVENRELNLHVENTKPEQPLVRDPSRKSGGIGLANVQRRLNILYPKKFNLEIEDKSEIYGINLWLKLP